MKKNHKKGFPKLLSIAIVFVAISTCYISGIYLYLPFSYLVPELPTKTALGNKYKYMLQLRSENNFDKIFYLVNKPINGQSVEDVEKDKELFIRNMNNADTPTNIEVNDVIVEKAESRIVGSIGIRINSLQEYHLWSYENGHWYSYGESSCRRRTPYLKQPEFTRALDLIEQRRIEAGGNGFEYYSCLDITYADLQGAEGVFLFNPQISSRERLIIQVDTSYREKDDLLTAILLIHELTHVDNYVNITYRGLQKKIML